MGCEVSADQSLGFDSLKRLQLSSGRTLYHNMIEIYLSDSSVANDSSVLPDDGYANRISAEAPTDAGKSLR